MVPSYIVGWIYIPTFYHLRSKKQQVCWNSSATRWYSGIDPDGHSGHKSRQLWTLYTIRPSSTFRQVNYIYRLAMFRFVIFSHHSLHCPHPHSPFSPRVGVSEWYRTWMRMGCYLVATSWALLWKRRVEWKKGSSLSMCIIRHVAEGSEEAVAGDPLLVFCSALQMIISSPASYFHPFVSLSWLASSSSSSRGS